MLADCEMVTFALSICICANRKRIALKPHYAYTKRCSQLYRMNTFKEIAKGIPHEIALPEQLKKLTEWLDQNGYPISGHFELRADDGETIRYWLGFNNISNRFGVFGAGPDGSLYAFWLDDDRNQKIVHLGSEGGELYILASNFIDFLRLLAIGYDEIGFADLSMSVKEWNISLGESENDGVNQKFIKWVENEFGVTIPQKGIEIVDVKDKSFENWINDQIQKYS